MKKIVYAIVKIQVEVNSAYDEDVDGEVAGTIGDESDYNITLNHEALKIVETEMTWCGDENPI